MSHSKTGKLLGKAAVLERQDLHDELNSTPLTEREALVCRIETYAMILNGLDAKAWPEFHAEVTKNKADTEWLLQCMDSLHQSYKDRLVPGLTCPTCGGNLIVKEHHRRQRGLEDYVTSFVACTMFERTGCFYTEQFTPEIEALLKKADAELALQPVEF